MQICKRINLLTSSREISSLLKVRPGITPRFFSQKIAAKLPLKKIPSTAANAITRSGNVALSWLIQFNAQLAFFPTQGSVSIALNKKSLKIKFANVNFCNNTMNTYIEYKFTINIKVTYKLYTI